MQLALDWFDRRPRLFARVGALPLETMDLAQTARAFVNYCRSPERWTARRPLYSSSVNGQVLSMCARDRALTASLLRADSLNADGQPLVLMSRYLCANPLPERVATTDLFPAVAERAAAAGLTFYLLGASETVNRQAVAATRAAYPALQIVGRRNGYFARHEETDICAQIARLKPDILWLSLGVPFEQQFCQRNLDALGGVGIVKTAGGLFDFLAHAKPRAPRWMQRAGLEWLFRLSVEPRRLFMRYLLTNPHALMLMLVSMR